MRQTIAVVGKPINIGRVGENDTTEIIFNLSEVAVPNATYSLIHKRHGDENSYPCETYIENGMLHWVVKNSDVAVVGLGECELLAIVEDKVAKSYIFTTRTLEALDGEIGEVPPPYQPWVDSVLKEFAFSHKLENITCHYVSIPHSAEPHCDSEETEDGLILTFYIPMGEQGIKGDKGDKGDRGEQGIRGEKGDKGDKGAKGDKGDTYNLTEQDKEEIASQIHYDDTEIRAEIESKENVVNKLDDLEGYKVGDLPNSYPSTDAIIPQLNKKAEVFVAEYGVTTYAEVKNAYESGKEIVCKTSTSTYYLATVSDLYFSFGALYGDYVINATLYANNSWASGYYHKVSNFQYISDREFPTTKAVADFFFGTNNVPSLTEAEKKSARERIGAEGEYVLIEEITLTEPTQTIARNITPNGESYNFKSVIVNVAFSGNTETIENPIVTLVYGDKGIANWMCSLPNQTPNTSIRNIAYNIDIRDGKVFAEGYLVVGGIQNYGQVYRNLYGSGMYNKTIIDALTISSYRGNYPVGTKIKIYGRK